MLKFIFFILISFPALACLGVNAEGKLAVDGQTWEMNQNFTLGNEQSIPLGPYIFSMTVSHSGKLYRAKYKLEEKKGTKLILITKGEEDELTTGKITDIMAQGEKGQPHSIITLKLKEL